MGIFLPLNGRCLTWRFARWRKSWITYDPYDPYDPYEPYDPYDACPYLKKELDNVKTQLQDMESSVTGIQVQLHAANRKVEEEHSANESNITAIKRLQTHLSNPSPNPSRYPTSNPKLSTGCKNY